MKNCSIAKNHCLFESLQAGQKAGVQKICDTCLLSIYFDLCFHARFTGNWGWCTGGVKSSGGCCRHQQSAHGQFS